MTHKETNEERKKRFTEMSSVERKALIRKKMQIAGLQEGTGVPGKDLSSYKNNEIWDLIQVTSYFPEMQTKANKIKTKTSHKKKSLITWILIAITLAGGIILYCKQYPSQEIRREISVNGVFAD